MNICSRYLRTAANDDSNFPDSLAVDEEAHGHPVSAAGSDIDESQMGWSLDEIADVALSRGRQMV